jgi:mycothiol synthase
MLWPAGRLPDPELLRAPSSFVLRQAAGDEDAQRFRELMKRVDLGRWDDETLARTTSTVVRDGWQVIVHESGPELAATGMGHHRPVPDLYPDGYEVGWIAASPDHSGHGLGRIITAIATAQLIGVGAECIYLQTDDHRVPALKSYLSIGFVPHLWADGMTERWQAICGLLDVPFTPEAWPDYHAATPR